MILLTLTLILCLTGNIYNLNIPSFGSDDLIPQNNTEGGEINTERVEGDFLPTSSNSNTHLSFMGEDIFICKKWLCKDSQENALCQCDKLCVVFGDCCVDALELYIKPYDILNVVADPMNWFEKSEPKADIDPIILLLKYGKCIDYGSDIFLVVAECPSNYDNLAVRTNCKDQDLDLLQSVPVTAKDVPMLNFNNMFCAYCHGVPSEQLIFWDISATCPLTLSVEEMTLTEKLAIFQSNCTIEYKPPKRRSRVRRCLSEIYNKCLKNVSQRDSLVCNAYYAPYDSFANRHCAVCYNETKQQNECESEKAFRTIDKIQEGMTMDQLFRIDLNSAHTDDTNSNKLLYICGSSKSQDLKKEKCTYPFCPAGFKKIGFKCQGAMEKLNLEGLIPIQKDTNFSKETVLFIGIHTVASKGMMIGVSNVLMYIEELVNQVIHDNEVKDAVTVNVQYRENGVYEIEMKTVDVSLVSGLLSWMQKMKETIANDMIKRGIVLNEIIIADTKHFDKLSCGDFEIAILQNLTLYQTENEAFWFFIENNRTIGLSRTRYSISLSLLADDFHGDQVAYCYAYINCSLLILDKTEFTIKEGKIYVIGFDEELPTNKYIEMWEYLFVCEEVLKLDSVTGSPFQKVISILTKVTLSLSVFCLMVFLVLHINYSKFRNLHGKSMMCFALALMIAHFSVIMDTDSSSNSCVAIAILRHYIWLCVFMWCGIIAFDLAGRFCTRTMMSFGRANEDRRFKKYCIVAWSTPLLMVTTCVCAHFLADGNLIGYGKNDLCWIGNAYALLATFFIPVSLIMLANIACLIVTVTGIETTKKATKNATKYKKDKTRVFMYIKVAFLLGLTWIFAFLASNFNQPVLNILQTLLNGLQGMFLLFAFLSNKRTINVILKRTSTSSTRRDKAFSSISTVSQTVSASKD